MSRAGRKRANDKREPSGKLSRAVKRDIDGVSPGEAARLRDAALNGLRAPIWGTVIGQLFAKGAIKASEFEAGKRWSNLHQNYLRAIDCKATKTAYLPVASGTEQEPEDSRRRVDEVNEDEELRAERNIKAYESALGMLRSKGRDIERRTRSMCEGNGLDPAGMEDFIYAMEGLRALATHWGIE